jgi:hypothetical protein
MVTHVNPVPGGVVVTALGGTTHIMADIVTHLSEGSTAAGMGYPFMGTPEFAYARDARMLTRFRIKHEDERFGSSPDALNGVLTAAGLLPAFDWKLDDEDEPDGDDEPAFAREVKSIAVASAVTGVRFTQEHVQPSPHPLCLTNLYNDQRRGR